MAENKTQKTVLSVEDFINSVEHEGKRKDGQVEEKGIGLKWGSLLVRQKFRCT